MQKFVKELFIKDILDIYCRVWSMCDNDILEAIKEIIINSINSRVTGYDGCNVSEIPSYIGVSPKWCRELPINDKEWK